MAGAWEDGESMSNGETREERSGSEGHLIPIEQFGSLSQKLRQSPVEFRGFQQRKDSGQGGMGKRRQPEGTAWRSGGGRGTKQGAGYLEHGSVS